MGKLTETKIFPSYTAKRRCWVFLTTAIYVPKYNQSKQQGFPDQSPVKDDVPSLELVLSVKGKITRLSVSPSGPVSFCFTGPTKRRQDQKRSGEKTSRLEGLSWKIEKRGRSWEKS